MTANKILHYIRLACVILAIVSADRANAQYFDWGQDPASVKWKQLSTPHNRFVFPEGYVPQALRLKLYMDTLRPYTGYGFTHGPMDMPVVMRTQNFSSNGLVMLAPKRMELLVTPPASTFAVPWLKQLTAHEYRHAVQYSNTNRGFIKVISRILGQQGSLVGAALLPYWLMEGDAVLAETQMTSFGRGLQPSFTIDYRALALEGGDRKYHIDKYFCGSFRDYMPDHYHLGYQIASWAYTHYGHNIWDKVAWFGSRNPYMFLTTKISLRKFYDTSTDELFRRTFDDLNSYWRSLPAVDNSATIIGTPITSYTTYSSPLAFGDSTVIALKTDLDRSSRIVMADASTGKEQVVHKTGAVNTGLILDGDVLWWTELRQSTLWEQRVNSVLCYYDLSSGKSGTSGSERGAIFPAAWPGGKPAYVEYDYTKGYAIQYGDRTIEIPDTVSLHGLAYDEATSKFYFIGLSDAGMWIGSADPLSGNTGIVKTPSYSTIANLRAHGGKLYYNSIASGKDEAHMFDPGSGREYRLTESRYGSFEPSPAGAAGKTFVTTYTPDGYLLAIQDGASSPMKEVATARLPENVVNPPRIKWDVINIDTVKVNPAADDYHVKKYRKAANLFQFHSWAPVYFEPDEIIGEGDFNVRFGVTAMSQDPLNSVVTVLGYRYTDEGSMFRAKVGYMGFAPKIEVEVNYGLMDQLLYKPSNLIIKRDLGMKNYFALTTRLYLPILLSSGYHIRRLTPQIEFDHENSKLYYPDGRYPATFRNGLQKFRLMLQYTDNVRLAHRDFLPRWGYALRVTSTGNPFNRYFGGILSLYGRAYLPGLAQHHSLTLRATAQKQGIAYYNFRQKDFFPRGADYNFTPKKYGALAVDYQLPLCYPDGGIASWIYFKRIRANLFFDYARYKSFYTGAWRNITSYGLDLNFDISPFRLPSSTNTVFTISIRKPSDRGGVVMAAGLSLPI